MPCPFSQTIHDITQGHTSPIKSVPKNLNTCEQAQFCARNYFEIVMGTTLCLRTKTKKKFTKGIENELTMKLRHLKSRVTPS
jgi:hypothetical protein